MNGPEGDQNLIERLRMPIKGLSLETQAIREKILKGVEADDLVGVMEGMFEYAKRPEVIEQRDKLTREQFRRLEFDDADSTHFLEQAEEILKGGVENG